MLALFCCIVRLTRFIFFCHPLPACVCVCVCVCGFARSHPY
jgi:hypothetical protein